MASELLHCRMMMDLRDGMGYRMGGRQSWWGTNEVAAQDLIMQAGAWRSGSLVVSSERLDRARVDYIMFTWK